MTLTQKRKLAQIAANPERYGHAADATVVATPVTITRTVAPSQGYEPCEGEEGFYGDHGRRVARNQDVYGGEI